MNKIVASLLRQKILMTLSKKKRIAMMELVHIVNSTYNEVDRSLEILERENIITQKYVKHRRIIYLNFENAKTLILLKAINLLETDIDADQ